MLLLRCLLGATWGTLALASSLAAQVGFPLFSTDFPPEEFAKRRAAVYGFRIALAGRPMFSGAVLDD